MKYVALSRKRQGRLTATGLDGGLNRRDLPSEAADNQLTACCNFWWKDGVLRSRPAVRAAQTETTVGERVYAAGADARYVLRKSDGALVTGEIQPDGTQVWNTEAPVAADGGWRARYNVTRLDGWTEGEGDGTLLFLSDGKVVAPLASGGYRSLDDFVYVPQLLAGGVGVASLFDTPPAATRFEERNLLTAAFRAGYTTDGVGKLFYLPVEKVDTTRPIVAVYRDANGDTVTHTLQAGETCEAQAGKDGLRMVYFSYRRCLYFLPADNEDEMQAPAGAGISDNLTVTAYAAQDDAAVIGGMRFGCWFGGENGGLSGGTRLFVSGNPAHPHRIYWSDADDPLYFPADNYAGVGDPAQAVTAFGKQGELLVIFKEHELYAASYRAQTVTEEDTTGARFPIMPLHGVIGCDCPDTVQLCQNRLVWLTGEGRVYTLVTGNAYSQCNVRLVSGMIETALQKILSPQLKTACAGYYNGWYMLLAGGRLFLLRCADTAFERITSYTSDELAQRGMVWFCWEFADQMIPERLLTFGDRAVLLDAEGRSYTLGGTVDTVVVNGAVEERPIACLMRTKLFDFGYADRRKSVREVLLAFGALEDCTLTVTYVTDHGRRVECRRFLTTATDEQQPDFLRACRLTPHAARVRRFALELVTEGAVAIGSLTVRYDMDNATEKGVG